MRAVFGQVFAGLVLLAAAGYVLQVDDSVVVQPQPEGIASTADYYPVVRPGAGDRDYYVSHRAIVPYGRSALQIPILMYHYIRFPPSPGKDLIGYNLSVSPSTFSAQMDWLSAHGYHTITFNDVRLYWERVQPLPAKPVIITLDDGYRDLYTDAFPILLGHSFTAVAYIVSGFVGQPGYVTKDEIVKMDRYGLEIAAHTVNHVDLARSSQPWLTYQLVQSRHWLEQLVGHQVLDMAYPSGKYNPQVVLAVAHAGYYSATTEVYGVLHTQNDRYVWTRVRVGGGEPMAMFISNLGPAMPSVSATRITNQSLRLDMMFVT